MKKHVASLFLLLLLLSTVTTAQTPASGDTTGVAQAVQALRKAMIDPDRASLDKLVAAELSYGHSSGLVEDKEAFMEALLSGSSNFQTMELANQTITVVGQTALVRHQLTGATSNKGVAGQLSLNVLLVWINQNGTWKLLARQAAKRT